jgi:hypothetical protein
MTSVRPARQKKNVNPNINHQEQYGISQEPLNTNGFYFNPHNSEQ